MPSQFPGMDLYLESPDRWPAFHHRLIFALQQVTEPGLLGKYQSSIAERRYTDESGNGIVEEYLEIRERRDSSLVTLVDVVSPANKTTAAGRAAYLDRRRAGREVRSNIVVIDMVLQGEPMLDYSREGLPDWEYSVTVTRSTQPERYEIYTATLERRLPRFRLPLASDERDTVVDLQAAFTRAFELGNFSEQIDYRCEPCIPLTADQYRRVAALLKWPTFTHEEIAAAAHQIWEEEGRLQGRDLEHWKKALERLRGCER
jgi:hypothetical protein